MIRVKKKERDKEMIKPILYHAAMAKEPLIESELKDLLELLNYISRYKEAIKEHVLNLDLDDNYVWYEKEVVYQLEKQLPRFLNRLKDLMLPNVQKEVTQYIKGTYRDLSNQQLRKVLRSIIGELS